MEACLERAQQHRGVGAVLGVVGQGGVAQLVQRPAVCLAERSEWGAGAGEQFGGPAVGQPGPAVTGHRSSVGTARVGARSARNTGPRVRPVRSRGSSSAVPVW